MKIINTPLLAICLASKLAQQGAHCFVRRVTACTGGPCLQTIADMRNQVQEQIERLMANDV